MGLSVCQFVGFWLCWFVSLSVCGYVGLSLCGVFQFMGISEQTQLLIDFGIIGSPSKDRFV